MRIENIVTTDSEAGVIATLIAHPDFSYYSEHLLPNHFFHKDNRYIYTAITDLARRGISNIDAYNILESLQSSEATRKITKDITLEKIVDMVEMSEAIARHTLEEYRLLVENVMNYAFRRDAFQRLREAQALCHDTSQENIEHKIYNLIDEVMVEFSTANDVPGYKDVIDEHWAEILERQGGEYAGIPFKFPALNEYVTIEPGELFIFAAYMKQGKSVMLLNCAVDLLKQDKAVLYIDSELNSRLFTARILSHLAQVEFRRLTAGAYNEEEEKRILEAKEWLKTRKFTHIYLPMFDQQTIYTTVKKIKHTLGLDVLIVDYFKGSGEGDAFNSYQELGRFVDLVKNKICGDMGICGIGAAQATADGRVADSAKIGRNASTIALILDKTREEIANDGIACGNKKLKVVLNRNGMQMAPNEWIDLMFNGNLVSFEQAQQHVPVDPY